jgi:Spy/CpxP family protein refolding chaperone
MKRILSVFGAAALAAGLALAQAPTTTTPPARGHHRGGHGMERMTAQLGLTPDQQAQAKQIFQQSRTDAQPLAQQLRAARQQLKTDIKTGATQDLITKDSTAVGTLSGQMTAIHAGAMQKFYNILTPDQKTKLDSMHNNMHARKMFARPSAN